MESGHVSGTDQDKNPQAPNSSESKTSSPHLSSSSNETVITVEPGRSNDGPATPVSPTPTNEQRHDGSPPLPNSKRIPSHVFARTSTTTPIEWSVASSESLFSIHAGNTSFSKEQLNWMYKSGEHGYNCDSINISSPLLELPRTREFIDFATYSGNSNKDQDQDQDQNQNQAQDQDQDQAQDQDQDQDQDQGEFSLAESAAAEAMRKVLMEQECQQKDNYPVEFSPHSRSISTHSDASVKSFAFPILTGEGDKCAGSLRKSTKNKKELSQQPSTSPEENPEDASKPEDPQETPKEETLKSQTQKSTKNAGFKKWFNCFSCCPSCS